MNDSNSAYTLYFIPVFRTPEGVWIDQAGVEIPDQRFAAQCAKPMMIKLPLTKPTVIESVDTFLDSSARMSWVVTALSLDILSEELASAMEDITQTYQDAKAEALVRSEEWATGDGLLCNHPAFKSFRMLEELAVEAEGICDDAWSVVGDCRMVFHKVIGRKWMGV